jgi:hypothetical protein
MKYLQLLFLLAIISCSDGSSDLLDQQSIYLEQKIDESLSKIENTVDGTGMTKMGVKFLRHSYELRKRHDSLSYYLNNGDLKKFEANFDEFLEFASNCPDTVELRVALLKASKRMLNKDNSKLLVNTMKIFTSETIEIYREKYLSYFYYYDLVEPLIIPDKSSYKEGDAFNANIILQASSIGVRPSISVRFLNNDNGFLEMPVFSDGSANLKIRNLKKGTTPIAIRITQWNNGQERSCETKLNIEAD